MNIDEEILEAEREQSAEEVRRKMASLPKAENLVKIPLEEYLEMYINAVNYVRLVNILKDNIRPTKYGYDDDEEKILDGLKAIDPLTYTALIEEITKEEEEG